MGLFSRLYSLRLLSVLSVLLLSLTSGCTYAARTVSDKNDSAGAEVVSPASLGSIPPEKAGEAAKEVGKNWLYGPGLGSAAVNVGAIMVFPPYALYVLGNGVLNVAGYEGYYWSDMLPEEEKQQYITFYDSVTGGPGRIAAAVAGKEFRSKEVAKERLKPYFTNTEKVQVATLGDSGK